MNYAEALKWFRKAAEQGRPEDEDILGGMYANSQGVSQNYTEALRWFRKAANQGNVEAQHNLNVLYARFPEMREQQDTTTPIAPAAVSLPTPPSEASTVQAAAPALAETALLSAWEALNEGCRGGPGNNPATMEACERRTVISDKFYAHGCDYHQGDYWTCGNGVSSIKSVKAPVQITPSAQSPTELPSPVPAVGSGPAKAIADWSRPVYARSGCCLL